MSNPFTYAELHTNQPEATRDFYASLFDWKLSTDDTPFGPYTMIETQADMKGGMLTTQNGSSKWVPYIEVESLESATGRAKELGAECVQELVTVPDMGRFSLFVDPSGATFGIWQSF